MKIPTPELKDAAKSYYEAKYPGDLVADILLHEQPPVRHAVRWPWYIGGSVAAAAAITAAVMLWPQTTSTNGTVAIVPPTPQVHIAATSQDSAVAKKTTNDTETDPEIPGFAPAPPSTFGIASPTLTFVGESDKTTQTTGKERA